MAVENLHAPHDGPFQRLAAVWDSDLVYSLRRSPSVVVALLGVILLTICAFGAAWIAPHDPFDPASLNIMDARLPPAWSADGTLTYLLGTDDQGRDILSAILYGTQMSLIVGLTSVAFSVVVGVALGLLSGYYGGWFDAVVMRTADVQLSFPTILVAFFIDGVARYLVPPELHREISIYVVIFAIGFSNWVQYARTVRAVTMVERGKEYVLAARVTGVGSLRIMLTHVLPNAMGPVLVIGTIGLGIAILTEAILSFLGLGVPPTQPSLGTLIRVGNDLLFSGEWWISVFPGVVLVLLVLSVNLVGDWLRDALNPKLR